MRLNIIAEIWDAALSHSLRRAAFSALSIAAFAATGDAFAEAFRMPGLPAPVYYHALHSIGDGDGCEVAVVLVHGWNDGVREIEETPYLAEALAEVTPKGIPAPFIVAPMFPTFLAMKKHGASPDGRALWNASWGKDLTKAGVPDDDWRGGGDADGVPLSSFEVIDAILRALGDRRLYPNLRRVLLTGFSAGGQFVGRYVAVGEGRVRDGVEVVYAAMGPSTFLLFDPGTIWHYGIKGRPRYPARLSDAQILDNLSSRRIWHACGTADVNVGGALDRSPAAVAQGANRYERFLNFKEHVKKYPRWAEKITFHEFKGLGHDTCRAHADRDFIAYVMGGLARHPAGRDSAPAGNLRGQVPDAMRGPALRDVRLEGWLGAKMDRFIARRLVDPFMRNQVFDEARQTYEFRDDDVAKAGGLWRGEFWGKEMLSSARVADYLQDREFLSFIREECHRLMKFQEPDGYLGSYADKDFLHVRDLEACKKALGWSSNWNLWNRKYCIWGMFMAYRATGDREILASVVAQMDCWIDAVKRSGIPLCDMGTPELCGLPPMSILKPLLMIYEETGDRKYLDFAAEMLPLWDRADGRRPNFFRNAASGKPIHTWYPEPQRWAKSYEMMSCLDGILEYYRVTGERRCLDTVVQIRDLLDRYESNPMGGAGFGDRFLGAASRPNGALELCDAIHWMRLNIDLFLITGEDRYLDSVERCYYNNFFAGVDRDGLYGSFLIRALVRHEHRKQCGYAYSHCCVNNIPRSFMDFASTVVTVDRNGVFHVNQYQDATVTLDGVKFTIRGGYPVEGKVTVSVSDARRKVVFRKPSWCPRMDVTEKAGTYAIDFDMNPRLAASAQVPNLQESPGREVTDEWAENRHAFSFQRNVGLDVRRQYRRTPAVALWNGPLLLAKSRLLGMTTEQLEDASTVIGKGYRPILTRTASDRVMAAWDVRLVKDGEPDVTAKVCDFQSAADERFGDNLTWFLIWF